MAGINVHHLRPNVACLHHHLDNTCTCARARAGKIILRNMIFWLILGGSIEFLAIVWSSFHTCEALQKWQASMSTICAPMLHVCITI